MDRNRPSKRCAEIVKRSLSARRAWIEIRWPKGVNCYDGSLSARRAWIEIGVLDFGPGEVFASLSARRAWIEISTRSQPSRPRRVALRKESVDRNRGRWHFIHRGPQSLSARRAWIEMPCHSRPPNTPSGRSPQGERG